MSQKTSVLHVALHYSDKQKAEIFFKKILGMDLIKSFTISEELSYSIFGIKEEIFVYVYGNDNFCFEVFITNKKTKYCFELV